MMKLYKYMYEKGGILRDIYQMITIFIRQPFYVFTGRSHISIKMITEHFDWNEKRG